MYTILINLGLALLVGLTMRLTQVTGHWYWAAVWGALVFMAGQVALGLLLQRRVKRAMEAVQNVLLAGQKKLQQKINHWQQRPPGSLKQAQLELERDQRVFLEQALEASKGLEVYSRWTLMLDRQIATLRMQLYYQLKEFRKVDELLPRCMFMDPVTAAMKLARLHVRNETAEAEKFFQKQTRKLRYGQGAILYALYAWMLVQRKEFEAAHKVLVRACEKMENAVIKANRDHLANNRGNQFSNAGLADEWYALGLEQPKVRTQRQQRYGERF
jgi:BMFP domain-containing protein YqiC